MNVCGFSHRLIEFFLFTTLTTPADVVLDRNFTTCSEQRGFIWSGDERYGFGVVVWRRCSRSCFLCRTNLESICSHDLSLCFWWCFEGVVFRNFLWGGIVGLGIWCLGCWISVSVVYAVVGKIGLLRWAIGCLAFHDVEHQLMVGVVFCWCLGFCCFWSWSGFARGYH